MTHASYLADPAIPVTAMINYTHHRGRSNAFIGASAGLVYAAGKVTENFDAIDYRSSLTLHYNSGAGYTLGLQAGYRRNLARVDFGFQLQASYVHLSLRHGTEEAQYGFSLMYFPVQLYICYRL